MIKKSKLVVGMVASLTLVFSSAVTCLADESVVSKSQDNITVTKSAEWTTYNGQSEDANGNRYAKINFKIDTTKASTEITETISKGGDTDIVLILDDSGSMSGKKTAKLRAAAESFTNEVLAIQDVKVRVGMISFSNIDSAKTLSPLTNDVNTLTAALSNLRASGGTYLTPGIEKADVLMQGSTSANKFYIILSDGDVYNMYKAKDAINKSKSTYNELKVITIGYDTDTGAERFLRSIATKNCSDQPMFYTADVTASNLVSDLKGVFNQITETVTKYVVGNSLVDTIPAEFSIVDGTIVTNDTNLKADVSADKKTINWNWGENKLEKKVYEMSVITLLDKSKVPETYTKVNTNGVSIDPNCDSSKSAVFSYGSTNRLYLQSPKLALVANVTDEQTPAANNPAANNGTTNNGTNDDTPATGDTFSTQLYSILAILGLASLTISSIVIKKRRKY